MHQRILLALAIAALALGGATASAATVKPWGAKANPLCAAATKRIAKLPAPETVKQSAGYYASVRGIAIRLTARLRAIPRPTKRARAALRAQGVVNTALGTVVTAAKTGRQARLNAAFRATVVADALADKAFIAAGARTCAD